MPATETLPKANPDDDPVPWLRLQQTAGLGPAMARRLLKRFGLPSNIFEAGFEALRAVVPTPLAQALAAPLAPDAAARIGLALDWLGQPGNSILTLAHAAYPFSLLQIHDPPLLLYVKGRPELLARQALAIVGSRNASAQGVANAMRFAQALSEAGLTIVSGLALGIDAAAHQGGLRGAGSSIAVIGTGADIVYPLRNRGLAQLIASGGCIVTEYALGVPAMSANFPRRNRLISGLARGVLVIEAAAQSGSLITARLAAEQGRDIFAIPGSIHSALAKGCHALIKQGAKLVESADDVLQELAWPLPAAMPAPAAESGMAAGAKAHAALLAAMGHDPAGSDMLAERAGLESAAVLTALLALEMAGLVERLPGGLFQRTSL